MSQAPAVVSRMTAVARALQSRTLVASKTNLPLTSSVVGRVAAATSSVPIAANVSTTAPLRTLATGPTATGVASAPAAATFPSLLSIQRMLGGNTSRYSSLAESIRQYTGTPSCRSRQVAERARALEEAVNQFRTAVGSPNAVQQPAAASKYQVLSRSVREYFTTPPHMAVRTASPKTLGDAVMQYHSC